MIKGKYTSALSIGYCTCIFCIFLDIGYCFFVITMSQEEDEGVWPKEKECAKVTSLLYCLLRLVLKCGLPSWYICGSVFCLCLLQRLQPSQPSLKQYSMMMMIMMMMMMTTTLIKHKNLLKCCQLFGHVISLRSCISVREHFREHYLLKHFG